jgi:hypothetical protein
MIVYKPTLIHLFAYYVGRPADIIKTFLAVVYFWPFWLLDSISRTTTFIRSQPNRTIVTYIFSAFTFLNLFLLSFLLVKISWMCFVGLIVFTVVVLYVANISEHYLISDYVTMGRPFRLILVDSQTFRFECKRDGKLYRKDVGGRRMEKWAEQDED